MSAKPLNCSSTEFILIPVAQFTNEAIQSTLSTLKTTLLNSTISPQTTIDTLITHQQALWSAVRVQENIERLSRLNAAPTGFPSADYRALAETMVTYLPGVISGFFATESIKARAAEMVDNVVRLQIIAPAVERIGARDYQVCPYSSGRDFLEKSVGLTPFDLASPFTMEQNSIVHMVVYGIVMLLLATMAWLVPM
ncbi:hypothetical protein HDV05_001126, partial [Chytridiales sp. JEL 0842]